MQEPQFIGLFRAYIDSAFGAKMRDKPNYANCCTEPFWGKFFSFPSLPVPHCSEIGTLHLGLKFPFKEYQKEKKYHKEKKDSMNSEAIKVPKEPRLCNTELREDS